MEEDDIVKSIAIALYRERQTSKEGRVIGLKSF